jgi:hypothetical protein
MIIERELRPLSLTHSPLWKWGEQRREVWVPAFTGTT